MKLTENNIGEVYPERLKERAKAIRDAITAKSITAEMVGSLFVDLIEAAGSVRDALALFLDVNVQEIVDDIDSRLADVDAQSQNWPPRSPRRTSAHPRASTSHEHHGR